MDCTSCGETFDNLFFELTPESVHYAKETCPICGKFFRWVSKPEHEGKLRKTSKYTIESLGKNCCELCRRPKQMLGKDQTLEIHHKDWDHKNDIPENLLVVCTPCHKQIGLNYTYYYKCYLPHPENAARETFFRLADDM